QLHPPAGQGCGLRQRASRQGSGGPHGQGAARPGRGAASGPCGRRAGGRRVPCQLRSAFDGARRSARMIALLRGEVAVRRPDHVVILCGSVGYRASVSAETLRHVPGVGEEATLHAHVIVRDDALALYGFHSEEERELFLMLLSVQAVGPKVALAVLSGGDALRFQAVPGIGKRTAERIIVELREKVGVLDGAGAGAQGPILASRRERDHPRTLARDGLLELGYAVGEAEELLRDADGDSAEELIGQALRLARSTT